MTISRNFYRRPFLAFCLVVASLSASSSVAQTSSSTGKPVIARDDPARVWIEGDAIYFSGEISAASLNIFDIVTSAIDASKLNTFVVNSGGGDTVIGRTIGKWVFTHQLDIEVEAVCFSSCANYIFPAGRTKTIHDGAFVGWHGSETQNEILALSQPGKTADDLERIDLEKALRPALPEGTDQKTLDSIVASQMIKSAESRASEHAYFERIGLNREYSIHGLRAPYLEQFTASDKFGWTYSLAGMATLGITNVRFLGAGAYEKSEAVQQNLIVIPYD